MKYFRSILLFLCDSTILLFSTVFCLVFSHFFQTSTRNDEIHLVFHLAVLFGCVTLFQFLFRTYSSLWRYAESREYLVLLLACFCGFFPIR